MFKNIFTIFKDALKFLKLQFIKKSAILYIPYSRKVWWDESLVNLANYERFAKLKSSKLHTGNFMII